MIRRFHAAAALKWKPRFACSVRTLGSCSIPPAVARVWREETSARLRVFSFRCFDESVFVRVRLMKEKSCASMMFSSLPQVNWFRESETWSNFLRPTTIRTTIFKTFCSRFFCVLLRPPQTVAQYRMWGITSASIRRRRVQYGILLHILPILMIMTLHFWITVVMCDSQVRWASMLTPNTLTLARPDRGGGWCNPPEVFRRKRKNGGV